MHLSTGLLWCREALLLPSGDRGLRHRRFRVRFSKNGPTECFSVVLDISLLQSESAMEERKVGLPNHTELFTFRFQTLWMRDKAFSLPGKAKGTEVQNPEYTFLLLFTINQ